MKPLNQKERSRTYIIFSVLFLIGIGLVSIPFFSLYKLMEKENDRVVQEKNNTEEEIIKIQENEKFMQDYFVFKMGEIKGLINKLESEDEDIDKLNEDIGREVSNVTYKVKSIYDTTDWRSHMYLSVLETYIDLKATKNKKMDAASVSDDQLDQKDRQIRILNSTNRDIQDDLRECQANLREALEPKIDPKKPKKNDDSMKDQ